jgi:SAM-dependent methyltransferase
MPHLETAPAVGGTNDLREWERAEVARSASEASRAGISLRTSRRNIQRYLAPPLNTPRPLEYVFALLGDVRGVRTLDFGCGSGLNSLLLAFREARVVGMDISWDLLAHAHERFRLNGAPQPPRFAASSAHALPFADESFDLIVGIAVLHHLDLTLARDEVYRVLRPGGRAIFQEPVRSSRVLRAVRRLIPYRPPDVSPFERPLFDSEVAEFARPFSRFSTAAFGLPHVKLCELLPPLRRFVDSAYESDRVLLDRYPRLQRFSSIRVIHLVK